MIQAKCIQKFRDKNNKIYGYRLQYIQGNKKDVTPDQLKTAIKNKQINIVNLTLTSDNRLIDNTPTQQPQPKSQAHKISDEEKKVKNLIVKAQMLGLSVKEIPTACGHKCTLVSKSETDHIIYIPDDVTILNRNIDDDDLDYLDGYFENNHNLVFALSINRLHGSLKVIGGHRLESTCSMFYCCEAKSIDLSLFDTSKVVDMVSMFEECWAYSIKLQSLNTNKVERFDHMFKCCGAEYLDLSSFNTKNIKTRKIVVIDENRRLVTKEVFCKSEMFTECEAQIKATDPKILEAYKER